MDNWIKYKDKNEDIILSSRIRLARNIKNIPFPNRLENEKAKDIVKQVENAFYISKDNESNYNTVYLWLSEEIANRSYLESHLISNKLIGNWQKSAFIKNNEETVSLMINEEDHIRLQCITGGFNLKEAYKEIDRLDNLLEESLDFAYDSKIGYLTACPTNLGTGLRASVMLHLPALTMEKEMESVLNAVTQVGMTVRGIYGEGSKSQGNLYQISNQTTLGINEEEIINNLNAVVKELINKENISRERVLNKYKYEIEDRIYRSLGILKSAVILNFNECMNLLSNVRMGVELGIIKNVDKIKLNQLMVEAGCATLQNKIGRELTDRERDLNRAEIIRNSLKNY